MKTNFKRIESPENKLSTQEEVSEIEKDLTQEEFEQYVINSGAKGSFMIYRDAKSEKDELGIDEL
mgnify:FL=1